MSSNFVPIDENCNNKGMDEGCRECPSMLECYETNE